MNFRIGTGMDVHQLAEGRELWLGGVRIPHHKGAVGHSDADVLLHAICDALLGSLALGDIGMHFPDSDEAFKNIDSKILLQRTYELIRQRHYRIVNVDSSLCLESPKVLKYAGEMKKVIAGILELNETDISIKATTAERLGFIGREEGVVAFATVLVESIQADRSKSYIYNMSTVKVRIVNQSPHPLPEYATVGSAGMDIRAHLEGPVTLQPMERLLIPTGLFIELPDQYEAQVRPRSGLAIKHGLTCLNSPGTIDADYRGEVKVILINLSQEAHTLHNGDRIAQMVVQKVEKVEWENVDSISATSRGEGGFGHTGKI